MNPKEYCGTCHPEHMDDLMKITPTQMNKKTFFSFDRMVPIVLGILVLVATVQTIELRSLKDLVADQITTVSAAPSASNATGQPSQQANPYQALPSQVGGC